MASTTCTAWVYPFAGCVADSTILNVGRAILIFIMLGFNYLQVFENGAGWFDIYRYAL
jgi:hypothetical protein